jgi:tetratricopeptide (TPR) repeat protein
MNTELMTPDDLRQKAIEAYESDHFEQAIEDLRAACSAYEEAGDQILAAEMRNNLCVVYLKLDQPKAALSAVEGTPEIFAAVGDDKRTAQAYGNLGSALEAIEHYDAAGDAYRKAVDLFAEIGETDDRSHTLKALSQMQLKQGQTLDAVASMQAGLEDQSQLGLGQRIIRWILKLPSRLLGG